MNNLPRHGLGPGNLPFPRLARLLALGAAFAAWAAPAAGLSLRERIETRRFPSVFQAWTPAQVPGEAPDRTLARHDLVWGSPRLLGLEWDGPAPGLATRFRQETIGRARQRRHHLLALNPHLVLLCEIRYRDASAGWLGGLEHPWWLRDESGRVVPGWEEGGFYRLDFRLEAFRRQAAAQAAAATAEGLFDGVLLDWWHEEERWAGRPLLAARTNLLAAIREAIGPDKLILVNANDRRVPASAPWINGLFMECYDTSTPGKWRQIASTLRWAETALREPRANCVEFWRRPDRPDLARMRAVTTLVLTHSNGYCLFSDPNDLPTPDHRHLWYPFWEKRLGRPRGPGQTRADGAVWRRFEGGVAAFNPLGNRPVTLLFGFPMRSVATGRIGRRHDLPPGDGDLFERYQGTLE